MVFIKRLFVVALTVLVANITCYLYYNPTHNSIKNSYRLEPNGIGFQAMEGCAFTFTDANGFSNESLAIEKDGCILVMGSSQGSGQNVSIENRFSDCLNKMLGFENSLKVYNVSYSGGNFTDIVHNYKELIEEFPQTEVVIIELDSAHLKITESEYKYALKQVSMVDSVTGEKLAEYSTMEKMINFLKNSLPLGLLAAKQYIAWQPLMTEISFDVFERNTDNTNISYEQNDEMMYWEECLKMISQESDAKIVIVFHDPIDIEADSCTNTSLPVKMQEIEKLCNKYGIDVINMIPIFTQNYLENYELPYGFHNTKFNEGHLNKIGHKLIAEQIYLYLMENSCNGE